MNIDSEPVPHPAEKVSNNATVLQVTYDDPELIVLGGVASSSWCENLKDALKSGRMTTDLWHIGLPDLQRIESVSIIDNRYLVVQVVVEFDEYSTLESILENSGSCLQQVKIKSITVSKEPETDNHASESHSKASETSVINPPITTILDYHLGRLQAPDSSTPLIPFPSLDTPCQKRELIVHDPDNGIPTGVFPNTEISRKMPSYIATPPISPSPAMRGRRPRSMSTLDPCSLGHNSASEPERLQVTRTRSDSLESAEKHTNVSLESELRKEFESILNGRMAELQATFSKERFEFQEHIENMRTEFEWLLAQRLAEVQANFNQKERDLQARIASAEKEAARERSRRFRNGAATSKHIQFRDVISSRFDPASSLSTYDPRTLDLELEDRRLARCRLAESAVQSTRQLEKMERHLRWYKHTLADTKQRLVDAEERIIAQDRDTTVAETSQYCQDAPDTLAQSAMECSDDESEDVVLANQTGPCQTCEIRKRSLRLSELHVRTMELRVTMFERRVIETESQAVSLMFGLQAERRKRKQTESDLDAERQRRLDAEAGAVAVARETKWPFVVPGLLDMFLKFEGLADDVLGLKERG